MTKEQSAALLSACEAVLAANGKPMMEAVAAFAKLKEAVFIAKQAPKAKRYCVVDQASITMKDGGGDGAYDLHDVAGSPEEIGKAIGESLAASDICSGRQDSFLADGAELYLRVTVKFAFHPVQADE